MDNTREQGELAALLSAVTEMAYTKAAQISDDQLREDLANIIAAIDAADLTEDAEEGLRADGCSQHTSSAAEAQPTRARVVGDAWWDAAEIRTAARNYAAAMRAEADRLLDEVRERAEDVLDAARQHEDDALTRAAEMVSQARRKADEIVAAAAAEAEASEPRAVDIAPQLIVGHTSQRPSAALRIVAELLTTWGTTRGARSLMVEVAARAEPSTLQARRSDLTVVPACSRGRLWDALVKAADEVPGGDEQPAGGVFLAQWAGTLVAPCNPDIGRGPGSATPPTGRPRYGPAAAVRPEYTTPFALTLPSAIKASAQRPCV